MTAIYKEDNNLNYQEIKCVNVIQIISVTNCQTLKFGCLHFTKSDFMTAWFWTDEMEVMSFYLFLTDGSFTKIPERPRCDT